MKMKHLKSESLHSFFKCNSIQVCKIKLQIRYLLSNCGIENVFAIMNGAKSWYKKTVNTDKCYDYKNIYNYKKTVHKVTVHEDAGHLIPHPNSVS